MWFLFGEVSSSSWCLGWGGLYYCGTTWAFHIIILSTDLKILIEAHYANMPMHYAEILKAVKMIILYENFDIFLIFAENIDCGYTLELPH